MSVGVTVRKSSRLPSLAREVGDRVSRGIREATLAIEAGAKMRAPVDTGNLRNSIQSEVSGEEGRVSVGAEYGIYVELGTRYVAARPFLLPSAEAVRAKAQAFFGRLV